jgi:hypothetical protein
MHRVFARRIMLYTSRPFIVNRGAAITPIKLDYENPDETRPAGDVSPLSQTLLGYLTFAALAVAAGLTAFFIHWPYTIVLCALACGAGLSSWAHYRLRWHEFAPAMGIALSLSLFVAAIVGMGWLILKML